MAIFQGCTPRRFSFAVQNHKCSWVNPAETKERLESQEGEEGKERKGATLLAISFQQLLCNDHSLAEDVDFRRQDVEVGVFG